MLLDHDNVDCLSVLKGEESETSRPSGAAVSHDGAFDHLAKLGKVIAQGFYSISVRIRCAMLGVVLVAYDPWFPSLSRQ